MLKILEFTKDEIDETIKWNVLKKGSEFKENKYTKLDRELLKDFLDSFEIYLVKSEDRVREYQIIDRNTRKQFTAWIGLSILGSEYDHNALVNLIDALSGYAHDIDEMEFEDNDPRIPEYTRKHKQLFEMIDPDFWVDFLEGSY